MTISKENSSSQTDKRNPAYHPILGILSFGPAHGYDICRRLTEEAGSVWRLGKSQIYALLTRMERDGLVEHDRVHQENFPAKNIFRLAPKGEEIFSEWVCKPVNHIRDMRLEFLTKLWFARQSGNGLEADLIEKQISLCQKKIQSLENLKSSRTTEIEKQAVAFKMVVTTSVLAWLKDLKENCRAERKSAE